ESAIARVGLTDAPRTSQAVAILFDGLPLKIWQRDDNQLFSRRGFVVAQSLLDSGFGGSRQHRGLIDHTAREFGELDFRGPDRGLETDENAAQQEERPVRALQMPHQNSTFGASSALVAV